MANSWRLGGLAPLGGGSAVGDASGLAACRLWVRVFLVGRVILLRILNRAFLALG